MAFVTQDDILSTFEGLIRNLFATVKGVELQEIPCITYADAMRLYGTDKPDTRYGMQFVELNEEVKGRGFDLFDEAELVAGFRAPGYANTRIQIDKLAAFLKKHQIGAERLVWAHYTVEGLWQSSVDKFYAEDAIKAWLEKAGPIPAMFC